MNILGIDFGLKRIGTAVGSTESGIAFAREVLNNDQKIWSRLAEIIRNSEINKIVVGLPLKRDQSEGDIAMEIQDFVEELLALYEIPVEVYDERYSSKLARAKLKKLQLKKNKRREPLDAMAAQVILQEYLDGGQ